MMTTGQNNSLDKCTGIGRIRAEMALGAILMLLAIIRQRRVMFKPATEVKILTWALLWTCAQVGLAGPAMSPKVASQQPPQIKTQAVAQQPITVTVKWVNPAPPPPLASNLVAVTPLAGGATSYFALPATNKLRIGSAQVTAPSNSVQIMVAAIGADGLQSAFAGPVTNQIPLPPPPLTNVQWIVPMFSTDLTTWQKQTNQAWKFTTPGYWKLLTATNL